MGEQTRRHGLVALFGSGETSASGRRVFDRLFARLPPPIRVAVLETPEVQALAEERESARARQDDATADALRKQVSALGRQIQDTPEGFRLLPMEKAP